MQTNSYISAAALAAALLATPQFTLAQQIGVDLGGINAGVTVGGENLLDVDVGVDAGAAVGSSGSDVDASVTIGGTGSDDSLVDVDVGTGPNGGTLIDLGRSDAAALDVDIDVLDGTGEASPLLTGDVRIGSLGDDVARRDSLLGLIDSPDLADVDLDAAIDDTRVSILAAADLLGPDALGDVRAAIDLNGAGRSELRDAIAASVELSAILDREGVDVDDVLAVQIAENGAAEIIVLGDDVEVAALGDGANPADLDINLLSDEQLAEVDLSLLPGNLRTTAQLRLLSDGEGNLADVTAGELANIDLDLLSDDELTALDLDLLPQPLATAVALRIGDGDIADRSVDDLAAVSLNLLSSEAPATDSPDTTTPGSTGTGDTGSTGGGGTTGDGDNGSTGGNTDDGDDTTGDSDANDADEETGVAATPVAPRPAVGRPAAPAASGGGSAGTSFGIAALSCDVGVLALASGIDASPQAIANADSLELVRISGCERSLVDAEVDGIRSAISVNPAISDVLEDANIPLDEVIGATVQAGTLTLFIEPVESVVS